MMAESAVIVSVPATSANLGPGFDSLGLALDLRNSVEVHAATEMRIRIDGEGSDRLPRDETNGIVQAMQAVYAQIGEVMPPLDIHCHNRIPVGSGMGSSAASIVSGVMAANTLLGDPLTRDQALRLAVDLEGHPDNVAAAMLGGLTISSLADDTLAVRRVTPQMMQVVIALPDITVSTAHQRAALPSQVALKDAAANIGRAALVVQALADGDLELLGQVMVDRLHVAIRRQAISGYDRAVETAHAAGAAAVTISGAGPALIAFAEKDHEDIGQAMAGALDEAAGTTTRTWVLNIDMTGTQIER